MSNILQQPLREARTSTLVTAAMGSGPHSAPGSNVTMSVLKATLFGPR
jgi:hypothetical protein